MAGFEIVQQGLADAGGAVGLVHKETGQVIPCHAGKGLDTPVGRIDRQIRLGKLLGYQAIVFPPVCRGDKGMGFQVPSQPQGEDPVEVLGLKGSDHRDISFLKDKTTGRNYFRGCVPLLSWVRSVLSAGGGLSISFETRSGS